MYWIILIFFMLLSFGVSAMLRYKFNRYSQIGLRSNLTGAEVAALMLRDHGITDVEVVCIDGQLTDHYHPTHKTVNLSPDVFYGNSAASAAVAAHECGHAVQHATAYSMLEFRSAMVPIQSISGTIMNIIFLASFIGGSFFYSIFPLQLVLLVVIGAYGIFTLFSFITLPVEFDASRRALAWITDRGIVTPQEHAMAKDALTWAAMTYVVAALSSLSMLVYYIFSFLNTQD
ncbi:MAG: zinc metallopeptidase [Cytophagales bacterium]|nr:MAG: zinc metallopeptidase [Cytophagales bacterium]